MENKDVSKALMTPEQNEEYEKVLNAGAGFVGGKRNRFYIPTIKINNSDKTFKKSGIALGNFFLREKKGQEEFITDMGEVLKGIVLKVSYSIKSVFDPKKLVSYYSYEFDNFLEDTITVIDGTAKKGEEGWIMFEGSYKEWKEGNQIVSRAGNKNDFDLNVHLYILMDGNFDEPKVQRLTFKGRSMSEWFTYTIGDKVKGIESIYSQGIQPHNAIHSFASAEDKTPKGEKYWYIHFSVDTKINLESLKKVLAMQRELDKQIQELRGVKTAKTPDDQPAISAPDNSDIKPSEIVGGEDEDEVKIADVPFN